MKAGEGTQGRGQDADLGHRDSTSRSHSCSRPLGFPGLSPAPEQGVPPAVSFHRRTQLSKLPPPQARPGHSITEEAEGVTEALPLSEVPQESGEERRPVPAATTCPFGHTRVPPRFLFSPQLTDDSAGLP